MAKINPKDFIKLNQIVEALSAAASVLNPDTHPDEVLKVTEALKNAQLVQEAEKAGLDAQLHTLDNLDNLLGPGSRKKSIVREKTIDSYLYGMSVSLDMAEDAKPREYKRILDPEGKLDSNPWCGGSFLY